MTKPPLRPVGPDERSPLPSLVADDLVDLVRGALVHHPGSSRQPIELVASDQGPMLWSDGRPVALDYALLELLIEIRDEMRTLIGDSRRAMAFPAVLTDKPKEPAIRLPLLDDGKPNLRGLDAALEEALAKGGGLYLDRGRIDRVVELAVATTRRFLSEGRWEK